MKYIIIVLTFFCVSLLVFAQEEPVGENTENQEATKSFMLSNILFDGEGGVDGLQGGVNIEISSDGKDIYVAGHREDALAVFYYSAEKKKYIFDTVIKSGKEENSLGGIWDIAVTKDGIHIYITSYTGDSISLFEKFDGEIVYKETFSNKNDGTVGLNGPKEIIISPDDKYVYVVNEDENSIEGFARDETSGALTSIVSLKHDSRGVKDMRNPVGLAFNNDASAIYVASQGSHALVKFTRNKDNGQLQFAQSLKNGVNGVTALNAPVTIFVDINNFIYISGFEGNSLGVFVDEEKLLQQDVAINGEKSVKSLRQPYKIAGFPDGGRVIVVGYKDDAVLEFLYAKEEIVNTMIAPEEEELLAHQKLDDVNKDNGLMLSQVSVFKEGVGGVTGIKGAWGVAIHPNGDVLVTGFKSDALSIFRRDESTGRLTYIESIFDNQGKIDGLSKPFDVLVSNDNRNVYVSGVSDSVIAIFDKDERGKISFLGNVKEEIQVSRTDNKINDNHDTLLLGAEEIGEGVGRLLGMWSLAESSDGKSVYATRYVDSAVLVFSRDTDTGMLEYQASYFDGVDGVDGINGAYDVMVSPDGENVYVSGFKDDAIAIFKRDENTGDISFVKAIREGLDISSGMEGVYDMLITPDGSYLYVTNYLDDSLIIYNRIEDGDLRFVSKIKNNLDIEKGLDGASGLALNSNASKVYVASQVDDSIVVFDKVADGNLTFNTLLINGEDDVQNLDNVRKIMVSPDDRFLYATANNGFVIFTLDDEGIPSYASTIDDDKEVGTEQSWSTWGLDTSADGKDIFLAGYGDNSLIQITHVE